MKAVILYTLKSDAGKCRAIAGVENEWEVVAHQVGLDKQPDLCRAEAEAILAKVESGQAVGEIDTKWAIAQLKLEPGRTTVMVPDKSAKPSAASKFKPKAPPKMKEVLKTFPAYFRLNPATLAFVAEQAGTKVDCLVWLGHAAPGRLSAAGAATLEAWESSYISLMDVVQTIYQLSPRIVNFMACELGKTAPFMARTSQSHAPGGAYQSADAPRYLANCISSLLDDGESMVINASVTKTLMTLTKNIWFSTNAMDRHLVIRGGAGVTEVAGYAVDRTLNPKPAS